MTIVAMAAVDRRDFLLSLCGLSATVMLSACSLGSPDAIGEAPTDTGDVVLAPTFSDALPQGGCAAGGVLTEGSIIDRGFIVDNALEIDGRTLHFSLHVPDSYDGGTPFSLYVSCPGWEGLYFQGVGANLVEDYPFVANDYIPNMIVVSPQLDDWGEQSACDVIALTEWLLSAYNIDRECVYLSGNSGGGETASLVMGERPNLFRRVLHTISQWAGDVDVLADARVPVYMAIGEHDDYYGSSPDRDSYQRICEAYRERGLSDDEVSNLVTLDVKPDSYFTDRGRAAGASQHAGGGMLFPHDEQIMGWLFS